MILCLSAAHTSNFNLPGPAFFGLDQHVKLFLYESRMTSFVNVYQQIFLATFYLILLHLSYLIV